MSHPSATAPARSRFTCASWWFRSADGRLAIWQLPNPALAVWLVALVIGMFSLTPAHTALVDGVRRGALVIWALDEVLRGASPFRRVLGAVVLVGQLTSLALSW